MNPPHGGPGGPPWPGAPQDPAQQPQGWPQQQQPQQGWPQQQQPQQGWPQQQQQQQGWPQQQQQGWPQQQQQGWPQQQQQGWPQQQGYGQAGWQGQPNVYAPPMGMPNQASSSIATQGFQRPRLAGLGLFACGLFLAGINVYELQSNGQYYIKAMVVTPMALLLGMWLMIAGQPRDEHSGEIALWGKIGSGVSAFGGLLLGILACVLVGC